MNQPATIKNSPTNVSEANHNTVKVYAAKWGARVVFASGTDEHLAVVMHDDHVFAAASSRISPDDAYTKLAGRIRAKAC